MAVFCSEQELETSPKFGVWENFGFLVNYHADGHWVENRNIFRQICQIYVQYFGANTTDMSGITLLCQTLKLE